MKARPTSGPGGPGGPDGEDEAPPALQVTPTAAAWAAMSQEERDEFVLGVLAATSTPEHYMMEGRPHRRAKGQALDELALHFSRGGRTVYLADEMAVLYPGELPFTPDIMAVEGFAQPPDDERMAWVVEDEGRGLDFVLEVLHRGDRAKDLERNVERFARLGIREYFVYDRANFKIHGFVLASPRARVYQPLKPRLGRFTSRVLDLDLAVVDQRLRFFAGFTEVVGSAELLDRLGTMLKDVEARVTAAEARAEEETARAEEEAARADAEAERADEAEERARAAEERADEAAEAARAAEERAKRAEAAAAQAAAERDQQLRRGLADALQATVRELMEARGLALSGEAHSTLLSTTDLDELRDLVRRAGLVPDAAALLRRPDNG